MTMRIEDLSTARALAQMAYEKSWDQEGKFMVETYGWEDDEHFNVVIGSREWLRDGNPSFIPDADDRCILIRKSDGTIEEENPLFIMDKLNAMDPVGTGHPIDDEEVEEL